MDYGKTKKTEKDGNTEDIESTEKENKNSGHPLFPFLSSA